MKNRIVSCLLGSLSVFFSQNLSAQTAMETDQNYKNTTVVYKSEGALDASVLSQLDGSYGLGDVVRITVAPPKPAPVDPVPVSAPQVNETKSTAAPKELAVAMVNDASARENVNPAPINLVNTNIAPKKETVNTARTAAAPKKVSTSSSKSAKSSSKKKKTVSVGRKMPKNRKMKKQKYGCYKFN